MTTKEAKQWLWRARGIDRKLAALQDARDEEYNRAVSIVSQLSGMTVSGSKDPHKYDHLAELDDTIKRLSADLTAAKDQLITAIYRLEDQRYCEVLTYYYVNCMSLEQTAVKMGYSFQHVQRLKRDAIEAIRKVAI